MFDNDGTLWCEKPTYIQLDFIVRRLAEKAAADPSLAEQQPYKAAASGDLSWFGGAITKHYQGDDSDLKVLAGAVLSLHESMTVEDHAARIARVLRRSQAPDPGPALPGVHLRADGGIAALSRGARLHLLHRLRRWSRLHAARSPSTIYGIPPERVVGSAQGLRFEGGDGHGDLLIQPALDIWDDGPEKPVRIWNRIGRRPILAAGNSNGDDEMLQYSGRPGAAVAAPAGAATTTPSANSTTPQGRNGRWSMPSSTAGPSSA